MDILTGILAFLQVADLAVKVKNNLFNDTESKNRIADLYDDIGNLMSTVADQLTDGKYPHDKCAQMAGLLYGFKTVLNGKVDASDIERLESILDTASRVEQLFGQLNSCTAETKHYQLLALKQAAGTFKSEAMLLRV